MVNKEALRLALEALEYIYEGANSQGPHTGISWRCVSNKVAPVITALRQALANEALDKKAENARELGLDYEPAQQEPEPPSDENITDAWVSASDSDGVAYDGPSFERGYRLGRGEYDEYTGALVAAALAEQPAQQEPVVWMYQNKSTHQVSFQKHMRAFVDHGVTYETPLYTTPPAQRTWVGLTDEEYSSLHDGLYQQGKSLGWVVDQIEDKLREKNT